MRVWNVIAWAGRAAPSSRTSGKRNKQGTPKTGLQDKKSAHERETLAQNQNPTPPGSHRARPVRTGAVLLQQNQTTPTRRSTRPGCEGGLHGAWIVPDPFAPRRCSYNKTNPTPNRWSTRPGREGGSPCTKEA